MSDFLFKLLTIAAAIARGVTDYELEVSLAVGGLIGYVIG